MASATPSTTGLGVTGIDLAALGNIDLSDHTSYAGGLQIITIICLCLAAVAVALRIYVRVFVGRVFGSDDGMWKTSMLKDARSHMIQGLIVVAIICYAVFSGLMFYGRSPTGFILAIADGGKKASSSV